MKTVCTYLYALQLHLLQLRLNRALRLSADALAQAFEEQGRFPKRADIWFEYAHTWRTTAFDLENDITRVQRRRALGLLPAYAWWLPAIALVAGLLTAAVL